MIVFDPTTWTISLPPGESPIARQYDNLTRSITVTGVPDGWDWTLLVQASGKLDIIDLEPVEGGVGVILTAQQLAFSGYYNLQLRGTQGELVRHTDVLHTFIPRSLSGGAQWPTVPSEFTQIEQRVQALAAETETAAAQAKDAAEGVAANAQAAQEAAGQAQTAQDAAQSSAQQAVTAAAAAADGAKTAADSAAAATQAAQSAGDAVRSAQASAQTATAQAQSAADAAQQAGQAKTAAEAAAGSAEQSAQEAKAAAAVIPTPTKEDAGKVPVVNPEGTGYILGEGGGSNEPYDLLYSGTVEEEDVMEVLVFSQKPINDIAIYCESPIDDGSYSLQCYLKGDAEQIAFGIGNFFMTTKNKGVVLATKNKRLGVFRQTSASKIGSWYNYIINEAMYWEALPDVDKSHNTIVIEKNQAGKAYPIPVGTKLIVGVRYE